MHKVFCVIGRTASGKSTLVRQAASDLNLSILKSYTTRAMRENETKETSDHTYISQDDVEQYRNDMMAYTERIGYCSFATKEQLLASDLYIINPVGFYELKLKTKGMDVELLPIYITVPYMVNQDRAKKRGDYDLWRKNYNKENDEFIEFEKSNLIAYRVLNVGDIKESVTKLENIICKELNTNK